MPFLAQIAAWVATTLATGGINALLLRVGGSILLGLASSALTRKGQSASARRAGQTVTDTSPLAPLFLVYGKQRKGGKIVFMHTYTPEESEFDGKKYMQLIVVVAANRCKSVGNIYFDEKLAVKDGETNGTGDYEDLVRVERALGDADQRAFPKLRMSLSTKWKDADRLRGLAAVSIRLKYDEKHIPAQIPNITFDVEGNDEVLDPRTGTRGYTTNPALCLADYMAHPRFGWGTGIGDVGGINTDALIDAANVCDESVSGSDRYKLDGIVSLDDTPKSIVEQMMTSMSGELVHRAGQWHILAGAYRAPVATFDENDIVGNGVTMTTRHSMGDNFNAVRGTFVSPDNDWQADDFPSYESSVYLTEDGGERSYKDIELPFTISATRAQRLAKIELEKNRRQLTVEITGKLSCWRAAAGDTVLLNYARWGIVDKPFVVQKSRLVTEDDSSLLVRMTLRETSPLVYSWSANEERIYEAAPRTNLSSALDMSAPGITSLSESLFVTRDGIGVKPRVSITWSEGDSFASSYMLQGRFNEGSWRNVATVLDTSYEIDDVQIGKWDFRVRSVSTTGVKSDWSSELTITTTGLTTPPGDVENLSLQTAGGLALLKWTLATDLDVRIGGHVVIRHSSSLVPVWTNSVKVDEVSGNVTRSVGALVPGTYMVRFRDSSGNYGPVSTVFTVGAQAVGFTSVGFVQEDDEFAGTHSGTFVTDGRLMIGSSLDVWAVDDAWVTPDVWTTDGHVDTSTTYVFASGFDFGSVLTHRLRREVVMQGYIIDTDVWAVVDTWSQVDVWGTSTAEVDVRVEISTTNDDPSGSPVWSDYALLESAEVTARGVRARAILTTTDTSVTPLVERLRIYAEKVT